MLEVTVKDDGIGVSDWGPEGIGIGNARLRLAELYGEMQSLRIENNPGTGVSVTVVLPAKEINEELPA